MVSLNPDDGYFSCQVVDDEIGLSARPRSQSWSREHRGRCWGGWVQPELLCSVSTLRTVLLLSRGSQGGAIVPGSYSMAEHYSWVSVTFTERHHFPGGSDSKESAPNAGDPGSVPGLGRSPGEGLGNQPTPVFLPGEFHRQRSLAGCSPWGSNRVGHDWVPNTFTFYRKT